MFGQRSVPPRSTDDGEKPFWISFADLMTAMMILFLVVMVASLSSVTQRINEATREEKLRAQDIRTLCASLEGRAKKLNQAIVVDCQNNRISFGEAGSFNKASYELKPGGQQALQEVVPLILDAAESKEGRRWFKQVLIEGFTDTDGTYLYNLHLSLLRSEWVMCTLLDSRSAVQKNLSPERQEQIRTMFLAGGVSFNKAKATKEDSRRVELRMQFYGLKEKESLAPQPPPEFKPMLSETCQLSMS